MSDYIHSALCTASSVGCRYFLSRGIPTPVSLAYHSIEMVISRIAEQFLIRKGNECAGFLVARAIGIGASFAITTTLIGPLALKAMAMKTFASWSVGIVATLILVEPPAPFHFI